MNKVIRLFFVVLVSFSAAFSQQAPAAAPDSKPPAAKADKAADSKPAPPAPPRKVDRAGAYYHYTLAHMYEEQVAVYGRSDLANKAIEEYRQAIEADPTSGYLTAGLAELYAKTGRIRDAVLEAQDILKRDPNNIEARKLLGRIYLRSLGDRQASNGSQNVLKLAIEQYEQIVKIEPESVDDHLLLGRLYRLNNDLQKAENEFKTAVKLQPDSEEAVTTLAYLYNEEGDTARATQVLSAIPEAGRSAKLYSALGYTYEQQKQYKNAIAAYRRAIELDRDNLDAIRGLAQNLMNDGQTEAALEQYKVIADANPEDAQTYVRMADIYRKQGKFDLALENLKKAESMVQDSIEVPYSMAAVYQAQGRFEEAEQVLQNLLKKTEKPDGSYSQSDRNNRAVFLERLGSIYREQGNTQQAVETFRKMLALGDENAVRGYQQIIDSYREAKQWPQATAVAKEAVQKLPNNRDLRMVLDGQLADTGEADKGLKDVGSMLADRGMKLEEALGYIKKALELDPANGAYLDSLGWAYFKLGKYDLAEENLVKAAQRINSDPTVQDHLGDLYQKTGRLKLAAAHWEHALNEWNKTVAAELDPSDVARVQKKLESAKVKLAKEQAEKP